MKNVSISAETAKMMLESGIPSLVQLAKDTYPELFSVEKEWKDFGQVTGYYVDGDCCIEKYPSIINSESNINVHPTKKEAESALALSQLRQWRDKANRAPLEIWVDWNDDKKKYIIRRFKGDFVPDISCGHFSDMAFKTPEIRDQFMRDHETLLKIYFMID